MTLQQFMYFKTIVELGSYLKASQQLFVTPSNLSHSIMSLEKELQVPLFRKVGRNNVPTEYGEELLKHVNIIFNDIDKAVFEIQSLRDAAKGTVKIFCSHVLTLQFFPQMIERFYLQLGNNGIHFEIRESLAKQGNEAVLNGTIDLAFGAKIDDPELIYTPIVEEEMLVVLPKEHPLNERENIELADLDGVPLVTYSYDCGTRHFIDRIFREAGVRMNVSQMVDNERIMASMVRTGMGVAVMPRVPELMFLNVTAHRLENGKYKRPLYMIRTKSNLIKPVAKLFADFVEENISSISSMPTIHLT